jgi:hypothetical protein
VRKEINKKFSAKDFIWQVSSWLKWWLKAGNAHGLHSPFVFDLYNNVLSSRVGVSKDLVKRLCRFLGAPLLTEVQGRPFNFILVGLGQYADASQLLSLLSEEACVCILDIRENATRFAYWEILIAENQFALSVDYGSVGLLFRRKGVVKQEFSLKP